MTDKTYTIVTVNGIQKHVAPRLAEIISALADDRELNRLFEECDLPWQRLEVHCRGKSIKPAVTMGR